MNGDEECSDSFGDVLKSIYIPASVTTIRLSDGFCLYNGESYVITTPKGSYAEQWFSKSKYGPTIITE